MGASSQEEQAFNGDALVFDYFPRSAAKERRNYPEEYVLTSQDVQDLRQLSE